MKINTAWLKDVKVGDIVTRWLAGVIAMDLRVTEIDDKIIYCGKEHGWWFDRATGCEIDDDKDDESAIVDNNDNSGTRFSDVRRWFTKAIKMAKANGD